MTDSWLGIAIPRPGPAQKQGYQFYYRRELSAIQGQVMHSTEGSLASAFGELDKLERQASWTFSVAKNGTIYQHYPLESITWHGGGIIANTKYVGIEHEGRVGEPLTELQYQASLQLARVLRDICPQMRKPERNVTLWEHREMVMYGSGPTACPSNRIPWNRLLADLKEDEPMRAEDKAWVLQHTGWKLVRADGVTVYVVDHRGKRRFPGGAAEFVAVGLDWDAVLDIEHDVLAAIPEMA